MEAWLERVIQEKTDLDEKIIKLDKFIKSSNFSELDSENKFLLETQKIYMRAYRICLKRRIEINKSK